MPVSCRELCEIETLPTRTDQQLLDIWNVVQSGEAVWDEDYMKAFAHECWSVRDISLPLDMHAGELAFPVSDEDMRLINQNSLDPWVPPNSERSDFSYILGYAQSFAGYEYAEHIGLDLGNFANELLHEYFETGKLPAEFVTLRCCLFYEIRRQRHAGLRDDNWRYIQALFRAVCTAHAAEAPLRPEKLAAFNKELEARLVSLDRGEYVTAEDSKAQLRRKSEERREAQAASQNLRQQEAARRLAELGGSQPDLKRIPRRRPKF